MRLVFQLSAQVACRYAVLTRRARSAAARRHATCARPSFQLPTNAGSACCAQSAMAPVTSMLDAMTNVSSLLTISQKHSPPRMDLREGRLMDAHGDENYAQLPINHCTQMDVSHAELEYYNDVFAFMDAHDLLFYLYPVLNHWLSHPDALYIDSYLYSLGTQWSLVRPLISEDDYGIIRSVFLSVRAGGNQENWCWDQIDACTNIFTDIV